jgi:hypothetical protein
VLVFSYGNVALKYLPGNIDEIFSKYIDIIDRDVSDQKVEIIKRIKGTATLSVDGVTILSKSYLLYTFSKGSVSLFIKSSQLRSLVLHVKETEIADAVKKDGVLQEYSCLVYNQCGCQ